MANICLHADNNRNRLVDLCIIMIEELTEGEPIVPTPRVRKLERDASKWKIIEISEGDVTFQAGDYTFECHKSGVIYREWEKEVSRMAEGGPVEEEYRGAVSAASEFNFISKAEVTQELSPVVKLVDSQLEERQHRIGDLRKKAYLLDWCNHDKGICTGKCKMLDEIRDIEKKILGDP